MFDARSDELVLEFEELVLISSSQADRKGTLWDVARGALACRVDELSSDDAQGKIPTDDAVMRKLAGFTGVEPVHLRGLSPELPPQGKPKCALQSPLDGDFRRLQGSEAVPLTPGAASEAVKLASTCEGTYDPFFGMSSTKPRKNPPETPAGFFVEGRKGFEPSPLFAFGPELGAPFWDLWLGGASPPGSAGTVLARPGFYYVSSERKVKRFFKDRATLESASRRRN